MDSHYPVDLVLLDFTKKHSMLLKGCYLNLPKTVMYKKH